MKKKIAIIGAGIAGLTFANLIKTNVQFKNNGIIDLRISDRIITTNE